jgi:osmoprotectant transport system permease protein
MSVGHWARARLEVLAHDPLLWSTALLAFFVFGMNELRPIFAAIFPQLDRPIFTQDSFLALTAAHLELVALSSAAAIVIGVGAGVFVTRPLGREFRPLVERAVAIGQTFPPVAVLAVAAPLLGFGKVPALIALALYGLLPIVQNTVAGIESVPGSAREAAEGLGMSATRVLRRIEMPLAMPVIIAGIRTSVIINIGTAALASTVGARTRHADHRRSRRLQHRLHPSGLHRRRPARCGRRSLLRSPAPLSRSMAGRHIARCFSGDRANSKRGELTRRSFRASRPARGHYKCFEARPLRVQAGARRRFAPASFGRFADHPPPMAVSA